jgi:hypothetical protein
MKCGCETWSPILEEVYRLRITENSVLSRMLGSKKVAVTRETIKLYN